MAWFALFITLKIKANTGYWVLEVKKKIQIAFYLQKIEKIVAIFRMPPSAAQTTTSNPYLQQMYAAAAAASANPYGMQTAAGLIPYATSG